MGKRLSKKRTQDLVDAGMDPDDLAQIPRPRRAGPLKAQTDRQQEYIDLINSRDVVFALGPAGTGKTYVAVSMACQMLHDKEIERIIVTRPVVEAGEKIGFLPGEIAEKFDPYFAPVKAIMDRRLGEGYVKWAVRRGVIVAQPLAFMRGHTFENAFVILDEAQNTTKAQMKLFLTRLGEPVKCVVDGDESQDDLESHLIRGLDDAVHRFKNKSRFGVIHFDMSDVVRSGLVREVLEGYRYNSFDGLPGSGRNTSN